jgi:hypothetical protein
VAYFHELGHGFKDSRARRSISPPCQSESEEEMISFLAQHWPVIAIIAIVYFAMSIIEMAYDMYIASKTPEDHDGR